MAGVNLEFALNRMTGELSLSPNFSIPFSLPDAFAGESLFFKIYLSSPSPSSGDGVLKRLDPTGLALRVAIGTPGTVLNSSTLTVEGAGDDKYWSGKLSLAVSNVVDLFDSAPTAPQDVKLEFEISDGTEFQKLQRPLRLWNQIITTALVDPEPPDVALTKREAASTYLKLDNALNGQAFILRNEAGDPFRIFIGNDEVLHAEKIVP